MVQRTCMVKLTLEVILRRNQTLHTSVTGFHPTLIQDKDNTILKENTVHFNYHPMKIASTL